MIVFSRFIYHMIFLFATILVFFFTSVRVCVSVYNVYNKFVVVIRRSLTSLLFGEYNFCFCCPDRHWTCSCLCGCVLSGSIARNPWTVLVISGCWGSVLETNFQWILILFLFFVFFFSTHLYIVYSIIIASLGSYLDTLRLGPCSNGTASLAPRLYLKIHL